jgi:hypothetical protein
MHIVCIHMAMAVTMRIAFNIVLRFYRTSPRAVKLVEENVAKKTSPSAASAGVLNRIADISTGDLS